VDGYDVLGETRAEPHGVVGLDLHFGYTRERPHLRQRIVGELLGTL